MICDRDRLCSPIESRRQLIEDHTVVCHYVPFSGFCVACLLTFGLICLQRYWPVLIRLTTNYVVRPFAPLRVGRWDEGRMQLSVWFHWLARGMAFGHPKILHWSPRQDQEKTSHNNRGSVGTCLLNQRNRLCGPLVWDGFYLPVCICSVYHCCRNSGSPL